MYPIWANHPLTPSSSKGNKNKGAGTPRDPGSIRMLHLSLNYFDAKTGVEIINNYLVFLRLIDNIASGVKKDRIGAFITQQSSKLPRILSESII
jgi:hypothetical protein